MMLPAFAIAGLKKIRPIEANEFITDAEWEQIEDVAYHQAKANNFPEGIARSCGAEVSRIKAARLAARLER